MTDKRQLEVIDRLAAEAKMGRLSRRNFMHYAMAAGMTASAATGLWARSAKAEPKRGGTFRLGVHDGNTSDSDDPGTYLSVGHIQIAHTYRSYLTLINPDNTLGPDLATSWEASEDATEWTFQLARNASFHSGKAFTADDAIASINHHRGDDSTSAVKSLFAPVTDVVKNDDHSITIKLNTGIADLPWYLSDYHMAICPANADGTIDWQSGDGTGPYRRVRHEAGVGSSFERHDGWHLEGAYFDAVEITILNDPNARQTALVTGQVDAITSIDLKTMALLARDPNIAVDNVPAGQAVTLPMFADTPPFDNNDVRLALKYAINRDDIIEKIRFGAGTSGNDYHVSPNMPYWADIPQRAYDPEKARFHLERAGLTSLDVDLSTTDSIYSGAVDLCVLYAEHARAAGININVVREPSDGYWADVWLKKPFCMVVWGARPTPDQMLTIAYKDDAPWNESRWQNERFNELLLQAKAELNDDLRADMYREMQQIAHDDGSTVLPVFSNFVYARRSNVKHMDQLAASWECDGARSASRWWFE